MSSSIITILAIGVAGYIGASISSRNSRVWGTAFVIYASLFVSCCVLIGYIFDINPTKIMTGFGFAFLAFFIASIIFGKEKK
jgi:hypothetical protein